MAKRALKSERVPKIPFDREFLPLPRASERILEKLVAILSDERHGNEVTRQELMRAGLGKTTLKLGVPPLEALGVLGDPEPRTAPAKRGRGRPATRWRVNPMLTDKFHWTAIEQARIHRTSRAVIEALKKGDGVEAPFYDPIADGMYRTSVEPFMGTAPFVLKLKHPVPVDQKARRPMRATEKETDEWKLKAYDHLLGLLDAFLQLIARGYNPPLLILPFVDPVPGDAVGVKLLETRWEYERNPENAGTPDFMFNLIATAELDERSRKSGDKVLRRAVDEQDRRREEDRRERPTFHLPKAHAVDYADAVKRRLEWLKNRRGPEPPDPRRNSRTNR